MRVLFINETCGQGSHGKICIEIAKKFMSEGHGCRIAYGRENVSDEYRDIAIRIGGSVSIYSHVLITRLFDAHGLGSVVATKAFLKWADTYDPDMLWLHNIHGYYVNYELLFQWIKARPGMEVRWTLHDEWAMTGHCGCFGMAQCEKWKTHCEHCIQKHEYPKSSGLDRSYANFERKRRAFTGVANLRLTTPSQWLADLTRESYLKEYPVEVVYNRIDPTVFCPTESSFRKDHGLENKKVLLCVANVWQDCKGLRDVLLLQEMLDDNYAIVIVGVTEQQKEQLSTTKGKRKYLGDVKIPERKAAYSEVLRKKNGVVIHQNVQDLYTAVTGEQFINAPASFADLLLITRTKNMQELAALYTMADLFINPTREDNYPTVNLEAQACGTFVITYDTGGCKETIQE